MKLIIMLVALLLTACDREEKPQPPTAAEAERLNDAEEMLNDLANEEGAASEEAAPSVNLN